MATRTTNYNLYKPDATDNFSDFRDEFNDNMEIIDQNLGGGGSGGHTIYDKDGTELAQENGLQFKGAVNVSDDSVNGRTVVDVEGGAVYGAFIDTDKVISTGTITAGVEGTYTATEDCVFDFLMYATGGQNAYLRIDGKNIFSSSSSINRDFVLLKKGQVVTFGSYGTNGSYTVYGLLQGTNGIFAPVIYSDEERCIGVWRDNKPLYQKTIDCGTLPNSSSKTISTPSNLENLVDAFGFAYSLSDATNQRLVPFSAGGTNDIRVDLRSSIITITTFSNWSGYTGYLTIQYTKTTDV